MRAITQGSKRTLILGLTAVGTITGLISPAHATLQLAVDISGTPFDCVDNAACDINPATGILELANGTNINGIVVTGEKSTSTGTPANPGTDILTIGNISVDNTSGAARTITSTISDTFFSGPGSTFGTTGSGTFVEAAGATVTYNWYIDPANAQGADTPTDTPGSLVETQTFKANGNLLDSFSFSENGAFVVHGPFSMTMEAVYTLPAGGILLSRGQAMTESAIPESATWTMLLLGFSGLGFAGYRKARQEHVLS